MKTTTIKIDNIIYEFGENKETNPYMNYSEFMEQFKRRTFTIK